MMMVFLIKSITVALRTSFISLSEAISDKLGALKLEKSIFGIKRKRVYPPINKEIFLSLTPFIKEGICISLRDIDLQRSRLEIPVWVIGDFASMDDMYEEYEQISEKAATLKSSLIKKQKNGSCTLVNLSDE